MAEKRLVRNVAIVPATVMLVIGLSIAGCRDKARNDGSDRPGVPMTDLISGGKDLTLLHGDPSRQTDSLPDRITRLKREIARGEAVYSREELGLLERKLDEAEADLRVIQHP